MPGLAACRQPDEPLLPGSASCPSFGTILCSVFSSSENSKLRVLLFDPQELLASQGFRLKTLRGQ